MELKIGDKVLYTFPDPEAAVKKTVSGIVDFLGERYIFIKCADNSTLKISYKNFDCLTLPKDLRN